MLESTPGAPYGATIEDLLSVEGNMKFRYALYSIQLRTLPIRPYILAL